MGFRVRFEISLICDMSWATKIPGIWWEVFFRACFLFAAKLTSCSSMAVGVEAGVSATKRLQVEVTKILPGWINEGKGKHFSVAASTTYGLIN